MPKNINKHQEVNHQDTKAPRKNNFLATEIHEKYYLLFISTLLFIGIFLFPKVSLSADPNNGPTPSVTPVVDSGKEKRALEFLEKGNAYEKKGYLNKATEYWKIALEIDPDLSEAREKLTPSGQETAVNDSIHDLNKTQAISTQISKAQDACEQKKYDVAQEILKNLESIAANDPGVKNLRTEIILGDFKTDPDRPYNRLVKNYYDNALKYYRQKHYPESLDAIDQAQRLDPDNTQVKNLLGLIQDSNSSLLTDKNIQEANKEWKNGESQKALSILDNVLKINPDSRAALDLKKQIEASTDQQNRERIAKGLDAAKKDEQNNQFLDAKNKYTEVLKLDPKNDQAAKGLERVTGYIDPVQQKIASLEKALKANQKDKAKKYYNEIKELSPDNPKLSAWKVKVDAMIDPTAAKDTTAKTDETYNLGLDSYRKGDLADAKKFWEETLELDPNYSPAQKNLDRLLQDHPELKSSSN
jgi:tetratricopeptide (TPR) repeat protein